MNCIDFEMEEELIKYILELVDGEDWICEELHSTPTGEEYCSKHCNNLCTECVKRLMQERIIKE